MTNRPSHAFTIRGLKKHKTTRKAARRRNIHEFVLHYADGSDYVVMSNEQSLHNTAVSSLCHDYNHQFYAFNRLADTASLASIELDAVTLTSAK